MSKTSCVSLLLLSIVMLTASKVTAATKVISFDSDEFGRPVIHGQIIDSEYLNQYGVKISGCNYRESGINPERCQSQNGDIANRQVAFDTSLSNTRDPDLEFSNRGNRYLESYTPLIVGSHIGAGTPNNILILNENGLGCLDGICNVPDDESQRPAGFFEFQFNQLVDIVSVDFFDIENVEATNFASRISFYEGDNVKTFGNVPATGSGDFERVAFNISGVNRMIINMPGSGGIDNIAFRSSGHTPVAAPAAVAIILIGSIVTIRRRRHR